MTWYNKDDDGLYTCCGCGAKIDPQDILRYTYDSVYCGEDCIALDIRFEEDMAPDSEED